MVDYPGKTRLKVLGRVQIFEGKEAAPWIEKLRDPGYEGIVERVFVIGVEASDWNCPQHITPRFSEEEIRGALQPWEERFEALEKENEELRRRLKIGTGESA
jgi:hypothetical protein